MLKRDILRKILPVIIFLVLWTVGGRFYPLILLPLLYVTLVEKRKVSWLGFTRENLRYSLFLSVFLACILCGLYYSVFLYYLPSLHQVPVTIDTVFTDVVWYPVFEEVNYRGFVLAYLAQPEKGFLHHRNIVANVLQTLFFTAIHQQFYNLPFILLLVFVLGLCTGFQFIYTRNIYGCIIIYSLLNGFAVLLTTIWS